MHGDRGPNGARGSAKNLRRIGIKSVIGHSHSPQISEGCYQVGTSSRLKLEYNEGPSGWLNTHCVIHADGKRQFVDDRGQVQVMTSGVPHSGIPPTCHPHKKHHAKGLCKACYNVRWVAKTPRAREHIRRYMRGWHLDKKYGLTEPQYQELFTAQRGLCKLCLREPRGRWKRLHIDHNHKTGRIRGLLCDPPNRIVVAALSPQSRRMLG